MRETRQSGVAALPALRLGALGLDVPQGAWLTLLSPSGAAGAALIRTLAGLPGRDRASLEADGRKLGRVAAHRRGFGVVLREDALFPHLTLAENIAFPLRLRHVGRAGRARLVDTALELVQLPKPHRRPAEASRDERQRTALARATVFGPRILLLDEPLSEQAGFGLASRLAILRRIHAMLGATTVLATSIAADALALSDQVAVLRHGRLEQLAAPALLYARPATPFAAAATGEVNLLPGRIEELDDDVAIVRLDCGPMVEGQAAGPQLAGAACLFCLRPEHVAVAPTAAAAMGDGALDATVIEVLHLGDMLRLRLLLGSGAELVARRPAGAGLRGLVPGLGVAVAWQAGHAIVFSVEEEVRPGGWQPPGPLP